MESRQHGVRTNTPAWLKGELDGYRFFDARLARRLQELSTQLWEHRGQSIPMACQDWANTKAAYRFLDNDLRSSDAFPFGSHTGGAATRLGGGQVLLVEELG